MNEFKKNGTTAEKEPFSSNERRLIQYINIKLAALGHPIFGNTQDSPFVQLAKPLLKNHQEKNRLLLSYYCPADYRIQRFIDDYLADEAKKPRIRLPKNSFILDRAGLARVMSLPPDNDKFESDIVKTYRIKQGILHNPKHDRRTTKGSFHVAEGGFPIPDDKLAVPKIAFANLMHAAFSPPKELLRLPFTASQDKKAELFVSLLLRPTVCPKAGEFTEKKSLEIRFFAPGNLVGNLDFVEKIFGNAGDPYLPDNDAALDVLHWTGHTGCVILAPHLIYTKKKDLGLPAWKDATDRQRRDGMCWKKSNELYNDGNPFKITCRDARGVMVTIIADNYFGYCKKEVKTQISFSANLFGLSEEEHAGGAITFPSYILGREFQLEPALARNKSKLNETVKLLKDEIDVKKDGYAVDKKYPTIFYVPSDSYFNVWTRTVTWKHRGKDRSIKLMKDHVYILPSGYKVHMEKQRGGPAWRLVGTIPEGTLCHKPCTVSGGGKSEISKSIVYATIQGPVFVKDFYKDFNEIEKIMKKDFGNRFKIKGNRKRKSRSILSSDRTLGSVIKLFTPSPEYTDEYNDWIQSIPINIKQCIFVIKRYYKPEWKNNWREHFSVDKINGVWGHELKFKDHKLVANYLRIGREDDGSWRIYKLRPDYHASEKVQVEDDISASVVVPRSALNDLDPNTKNQSLKLVQNCESFLFQRPDDCVYRGYDIQAESDLATPNSFLSNFEPLVEKDADELIEDIIDFDQYSDPIKNIILDFKKDGKPHYFVSSAHPRIVNGKPTKNPRYLQRRPDMVNHRGKRLAEMGMRLLYKIPMKREVHFPVDSVLAGRRNNPPNEKLGIPALAVYNPIHYQPLPELFMDFVCSLTGKSPSTTGFGTEGALTKGPFNALWPVVDLNNALVSYILTEYGGFTSAAGFVGPKVQVDHDISMLIPEVWGRLRVEERNPEYLIKNDFLEKLEDFEHKGKTVKASRLGYRITRKFVDRMLGRMFENPAAVFNDALLRPETQGIDQYADGINSIVATMKRVGEGYFNDGSVEAACPPLKALIHIMVTGTYEGKDLNHPEIRNMFTRSYLIKSDWYKERLKTKQARDIALWEKHIRYLESYIREESHIETVKSLQIKDRLKVAQDKLKEAKSDKYLKKLMGTIGADPFHRQIIKRAPKKELSAAIF